MIRVVSMELALETRVIRIPQTIPEATLSPKLLVFEAEEMADLGVGSVILVVVPAQKIKESLSVTIHDILIGQNGFCLSNFRKLEIAENISPFRLYLLTFKGYCWI